MEELFSKITLRHISVGCGMAGIIAGGMAVYGGLTWPAMLDAFLSGINLAASFYSLILYRSNERRDILLRICAEQQEFMAVLLEGHIRFGVATDPPPSPPIAPRLH